MNINTRLCGAILLLFTGACSDAVSPDVDKGVVLGGQKFPSAKLENQTYEGVESFQKPCNCEIITGIARQQLRVTSVESRGGMTSIRYTVSMDLSGVGSETLTEYNASYSSAFGYFNTANGVMSISSDDDFRVVSRGKAPNFTTKLKLQYRFNAIGQAMPTTELFESVCR